MTLIFRQMEDDNTFLITGKRPQFLANLASPELGTAQPQLVITLFLTF
jgi:hypothetical protein